MQIVKMLVPLGIVVSALAACSGSSGGRSSSDFDLRDAGPGSTAYGDPQRDDGEVEISERNGTVYARQRVTIRNGFGGANAATVGLDVPAGTIAAEPGPDGRYELQFVLEGRGDTEEEARAALASMSISHSDSLDAGGITLDAEVVFSSEGGTGGGTGLPIIGDDESEATSFQRQAFIGALLPADASYALTADVSAGIVAVDRLGGELADLSSGAGAVLVDGQWIEADLDAGAGAIEARGGYGTIAADVSTGEIFAALDTDRDVSGSFGSGNGLVEIHVRDTGRLQGFDLTGSADNGEVDIDVAGAEAVAVSAGSAHHRTPDFEARTHQITLDASAGNGNVAIYD